MWTVRTLTEIARAFGREGKVSAKNMKAEAGRWGCVQSFGDSLLGLSHLTTEVRHKVIPDLLNQLAVEFDMRGLFRFLHGGHL